MLLVLGGCPGAVDPSAPGPEPGSSAGPSEGPAGPDAPGAGSAGPLKWGGTYRLQSTFSLDGAIGGGALGEVFNVLQNLGADDGSLAKVLVDAVVGRLPSAVGAVASLAKPLLVEALKGWLTKNAPGLSGTLERMGQDFRALVRRFELVSALIPDGESGGPDPTTAKHRVQSLVWTLDGQRVERALASGGKPEPEAQGVPVSRESSDLLVLGEHRLSLRLGPFLLEALNQLVIPRLREGAKSVGDLLRAQIDCASLGAELARRAGVGGEGVWTTACTLGLSAAASQLESRIAGVDGQGTALELSGRARLRDGNQDGEGERLDEGVWAGKWTFARTTSPIEGDKNVFTGQRVP
ncbi:MAG: hypothetical protein IT371_22840 [Deltaproteobacteria bacterium]|nr:hypothetical protein [Deltaproteobacteria bacterium]